MKPVLLMTIVTLAAIALILLIIVIVLAIPYSKQPSTPSSDFKNSSHSGDDQKECEKCNKSRICTSDNCLRAAGYLRLSLNFSVDPCDDFYEYVCGGWSKEHSNLEGVNRVSKHTTKKLNMLIKKFLISENKDNEPVPVKHARNLYKSCIDVESRNNSASSVLVKVLREVDLPLVPSFFSKSGNEKDEFKFNWLKAISVIKKTINLDIFFGFSVTDNPYKIFENMMYLDLPSEEAEPSLLNYKKTMDKDIIVKILKRIVRNGTSNQLEEGAAIIENMQTSVLNIRKEVNKTSLVPDDLRIEKIQLIFDQFLMREINKTYPEIFKHYFGYLFEGTNITIDVNKDVLFMNPASIFYTTRIIKLNLVTSDINLEIYVWFLTVVEVIFSTYATIAKEDIYSLNETCIALVSDSLPMAVTYGVADKKFSTTIKPKVEEMLSGIQDSFVNYVNNQQWIDQYTKELILDKNKEMIKFIGFPEWIFDKKVLEKYYEGYVINQDSFLENMINMIKIKMKHQFSMLRSTNKIEWTKNPLINNAYHHLVTNSIIITMAMLNFPLYNLGLEMLHYGAIGVILGHEMIHGFDNQGKNFDKFGNRAVSFGDWWSKEAISRFQSKYQCFVEQYDNYTLYGLKKYMQGKKTLGENLADNGGMSHAYIAYQNYVKNNGPEFSLPGFENFTSNQLFFLAYPRLYCWEINDLDALSRLIDIDIHAPNKIRVLNVLRNFPEFAEAFNCPVGSNMNPNRERCKVW